MQVHVGQQRCTPVSILLFQIIVKYNKTIIDYRVNIHFQESKYLYSIKCHHPDLDL